MKIKFTTAIKENACLGQFNLVDEAESQQLVFKGSWSDTLTPSLTLLH